MQLKRQLTALVLALAAGSSFAQLTVGVSFDAYQEERWKTDEAAIKAELAKSGAKYIMSDAGSSTEKQLTDIDGLIAKGAKVLIILGRDKDAILPAVAKANQLKIPVIAYDRLFEAPGVTYISFDNKEVGRMTARAILAVKPKGNFAIIKGDPGDANANFLREGQGEVLAEAIQKGDVKIVGEEYTAGWNPANAQKNMEQILTKNGNKVDAVIAQNDGMAGGVVAALAAKGLKGIPLSGQDGDHAALNRVALGTQTVSVWKNSADLGKAAAKAAVELGAGKAVTGATDWAGGEKKITLKSIFLKPVPVTRANLDLVLKAGHIKKAALCKGVTDATVTACK
jgi:D-xylose transport system substrate-binding protein